MDTLHQFEPLGFQDLYEVLGVGARANFGGLKKAYYQRAKECHPDRHQGDPRKEEEFKLLVHSFDVLTDAHKRRDYDRHLARLAAQQEETLASAAFAFHYQQAGANTVMDSVVDDILEEMVVGNHVPEGATLQTLMRDLESTANFIRFREGKDHYYRNRPGPAFELFEESVHCSSGNILYHYYLARASVSLRRYAVAEEHYRICLQLGMARNPLQRLQRIRRLLHALRREHRGVLGRVHNLLASEPEAGFVSSEERMIEQTTRTIGKLMHEDRGLSDFLRAIAAQAARNKRQRQKGKK